MGADSEHREVDHVHRTGQHGIRPGRPRVRPAHAHRESVQRLVAFINGLDSFSRAPSHVRAVASGVLRLTFRAADGSVLARAVEHPTGCASVTLSVGGRTGPALNDFPTVTS